MVPPDPVWVGSIAVRAGEFHVGVRTDDPSVQGALTAAYGDVVVDDPAVQPDYAVSTSGGPVGDMPRLLPYVAHGRCPLLRSRDHARLLRRLDLELGRIERLGEPAVPGTVAVYGMAALVGAHRAALVPTAVVERSTAVEQMLREAGIGIVEDVGLRLDPVSHEAIALPGLSGTIPEPLDDVLAVRPGRWPVAQVFWSAEELADDERPAVALVRLLTRVQDRTELGRATMLRGIAELAEASSTHGLGRSGTNDLGPVISLLS